MTIAYAERQQAEGRSATSQPSNAPRQFAKNGPGPAVANESLDKLLSARGSERADRKKAGEAEIPATRVAAAPAPAGAFNAASERQYGLAGGAIQPSNVPAPAAPTVTLALAATPATAVAADESSKLMDAEVGKQALAFRSVSELSSANRLRAIPSGTNAVGTTYAASLKLEPGPGVSQRFALVTGGEKAKLGLSDRASTELPVLASFNVQQNGSELRVVDGDGSVYSGYLQLAIAPRGSGPVKAEAAFANDAIRSPKDAVQTKPAARLEPEQLMPQAYFFRVAGTNRSLRQPVVFTGNLLPAASTNKAPPAVTNLGMRFNFERSQDSSAQMGVVPLMNTRISGKVVVGNANAVEINAEPTK
jgi:hypothetical protein